MRSDSGIGRPRRVRTIFVAALSSRNVGCLPQYRFPLVRTYFLSPLAKLFVTQTPFQSSLWRCVTEAHAAGDRADARIMMRMIEVIDEGDYATLNQHAQALRGHYRDRLGRVPSNRAEDGGGPAVAAQEGLRDK